MATANIDTQDKATMDAIANLTILESTREISEEGQEWLDKAREANPDDPTLKMVPIEGEGFEGLSTTAKPSTGRELTGEDALTNPIFDILGGRSIDGRGVRVPGIEGQSQFQTPTPEPTGSLNKFASQAGLEVAGGLAGRTVGGRLGGVPGRVAGSALGEAGGTGLAKVGQMLGLIDKTTPITATDALLAAGLGGSSELVTEGIALAIKGKKLSKGLTEEGKELVDFLNEGGLKTAPALVNDSKFLGFLHNIANSGIFSNQIMSNFIRKGQDFTQGMLDSWATKFVAEATPEARNKAFTLAIRQGAVLANKAMMTAASKLDNLAGVTTAGNPMRRTIDANGEKSLFLDAMVDIVNAKPQARIRLMKRFMDDVERFGSTANKMGRMFNVEKIGNMIAKLNDPKTMRGMNNALVNTIVGKEGANPRIFANLFFKPEKAQELRAFKKQVSKKIWQNVEAAYVKHASFNALTEDPESAGRFFISGKKLLAQINKLEGGGTKLLNDQTFREIFTNPADSAKFKKFARLLDKSQGGPSTGTGSMLIQMLQGGAVVGIAGFGTRAVATALKVLLAPVGLAKMMTNDGVINLLTTGAKGENLAKTSFMNRLVNILTKENIPFSLHESQVDAEKAADAKDRLQKVDGNLNNLFTSGLNSL